MFLLFVDVIFLVEPLKGVGLAIYMRNRRLKLCLERGNFFMVLSSELFIEKKF